ncbi:MAG: phosphatase PAP2 family protein [Candidatus Methanoperedens sp.]|nr:phosphatase PAP2 family protein [Candidatus Methanoperedens sp.]
MSIASFIESIDRSVFLEINLDFQNSLFDTLFPFLRDFTFVFWIGFIIYLLVKKEKKLALLMTAGIIIGAIFTFPIKYFFERERPYEQLLSARLIAPMEFDPSFPSGHTEMSFLATTIVSRFHPEYSKYLYAFSIVVALSRIYVGVHFPIDTIGGVIIGILIGRLMLMLAERRKSLFWEEIK